MDRQKLFDKNLRFIVKCNPKLKNSEEAFLSFASSNHALIKRILDANYESELLKHIVASKVTLLGFVLHRIRDSESLAHHTNIVSNHKSASPNSWLDIHDDYHLSKFLVDLWNKEVALGLESSDCVRAIVPPGISQVIIAGIGDFREVDYIINELNPRHILFLFEKWEQLSVSLYQVDWEEYIQLLESKGITYEMAVADNKEAIRSHALKFSLLSFEHTLLYRSDEQIFRNLYESTSILFSRSMIDCISYLGYTVDEYNMIINTIKILASQKVRKYEAPSVAIGGKYIVCGSGPSLDRSLNILSDLQHSHVVVACGSNYKFLIDNNIRVDFLLLIERADEVYEVYKDYISENPASNTKLVMSSTCHYALPELFSESAVFFRPALTPLALFCDTINEVINFEGPQAVNAGLAFVSKLNPEQVCLIGVDLGTADPSQQRSAKVLANTERKMDVSVPGNLRESVLSESGLLDVKRMLELCISSENLNVINLSDGALIDGAVPSTYDDYIKTACDLKDNLCQSYTCTIKTLNDWWESLCFYSRGEVYAKWKSKNLRASTYQLSRRLEELFAGNVSWFPDLQLELDKLLVIQGSLYDQVPVRIMRSTVYRSTLALTQALLIAAKRSQSEELLELGAFGRNAIAASVCEIEHQIYDICDYVDSSLLDS